MSSNIKGILAKEIADKRTLVYETKGTEVYALRKINRSSLKEEIELRVLSPEGEISRMFNVTMLSDLDPERIFRDIIGCSGLTLNDIKKLSKNIQIKHDEIKKSMSEESGLEDVLGLVYELLEDRANASDKIKNINEKLDDSILIKEGCYLMKAKVLREIADEIEINYTVLRKELVSLGFIEVGRGRDSVSISIQGRKMKLIKIDRAKFKRIFDAEETLETVSGQ